MIKTNQSGFTLIELVVVIVILGILSAFAVPRFMGLETQARAASVNALAGSLKSSAALAHSISIASAIPHNQLIRVEGTTDIAMNFAYPTRASVGLTLQDAPGGVPTGFTRVNVGNNAVRFQRIGAAVVANCSVTYTVPAANGNAPTITTNVTAC